MTKHLFGQLHRYREFQHIGRLLRETEKMYFIEEDYYHGRKRETRILKRQGSLMVIDCLDPQKVVDAFNANAAGLRASIEARERQMRQLADDIADLRDRARAGGSSAAVDEARRQMGHE